MIVIALTILTPSQAVAALISPGSIAIGLQETLNTFSSGIPGASVPIDMHHPSDGRLYIAAISGQVLASDGSYNSLFLDIASNPDVPFTSDFAGGLLSMAFHRDYLDANAPGYHKFYTFSTDYKTVNQTGSSSTVSPGNELTGVPDFWHPEMYAPATSGNPLTDWTNPNSPSSGNTDFDHFNVIREWTATSDGSAIDAATTPRVVLRMAHGFAGKGSHNGGSIRFGPDGYMYITIGDGGGNAGRDYDGSVNNGEDGHTDATGNGQDRSVVYGKVLRIDPTAPIKNSANGEYGIPAVNPYVIDDSNANFLDEIYAYGFRNPWKINFDNRPGGDGSLYLSDVGQHHREEIDVIVAGGNYGWGYLEGNVRLVSEDNQSGQPDPTDLADGTHGTPVRIPAEGWDNFSSTAPLVDYRTRRQYAPNGASTTNRNLIGEGTAATGGFVYRGSEIEELYGMYVFGDYSTTSGSRPPPPGTPARTGRLFYVDPTDPSEIFEFQIAFGASEMSNLLGFGDDATGELYVLFDNGNVLRILGLPAGDFNLDGNVDANDLTDAADGWIARFGDDLDGGDLLTWQRNLGVSALAASRTSEVPEPTGALLILTGIALRRLRFFRTVQGGETFRERLRPDS